MRKFWDKVCVLNADECWNWLAVKRNGYGRICINESGKYVYWSAHRFAWVLEYNEDPGKLLVCHSCDNPSCVNPKHLFLGTYSDNALDKVKKGRDPNKSKRLCPRGHEYEGENLFISRKGHRQCLTCRRLLDSASQKRRRSLGKK